MYEFVLLDDTYDSVTIITDSIPTMINSRINHSFESDDELWLLCSVLVSVGCCEIAGIDNSLL
jgi:hypothetical protein